MKRFSAISLAFLIFCLLFSSAWAASYYVDSVSGNDGNIGSEAEPIATVAKVNSLSLNAGDHIYFKCGGSWAWVLAPQASGTSNDPIVYASYGSGARPQIICPYGYGTAGLLVYGDAQNPRQYLMFTGIDFGNGSGTTTDASAIAIVGNCSNISIENCTCSSGGAVGSAGLLSILPTGSAAEFTLENVDLNNSMWDGITIAGDSRVGMTSVTVDGWRMGYGVRVVNTSQISMTGCLIQNGSRYNQNNVWPTGLVLNDTAICWLIDSTVTGCPEDGIDASGASGLYVFNCVLSYNGDGDNSSCGDGATSHGTAHLEIYDGSIHHNYRDGVGVASSGGGAINGVNIYSNGLTHPTISAGLYYSGASGASGAWGVQDSKFTDHADAVWTDAQSLNNGLVLYSSYNTFCNPVAFVHGGVAMGFSQWASTVYDSGSSVIDCGCVCE